ncbi:hypothetical protein E2P81_ATG01996 [Venturia nashicola]|uniref:Uncharacterized protein n=1 Tax=Venturia nashicola TaxID=86259 RepID=A0A4Z1P2C1_9PEZI|nr:hypothetical protein E6O75_ATG02037 [Venturia nashicola]TLD35693.1 hypothetical protein E2P81_ATG01996 [Venturia nashicola]
MKLSLLPILCLLGAASSTPIALEERQFTSSFPVQGQAKVQQKATGPLISKAWTEVGQTYTALTTAFKCVSGTNPLNPPPSLLLNCGVGEAHKAIANKLWETTSRFAPNSVINYLDAGSSMVAASSALTATQEKAFKAIGDNWAVSVRTRERQLVYESLVQQLNLYQTWAKAYNNLMPVGTKTAGDVGEANIVNQYKTLIKKYQWDVPS